VPIKSKNTIDSPARGYDIRSIVNKKGSLREFYLEVYNKFLAAMNTAPAKGLAVELGSGAGFIKAFLPEVLATDMIAYDGIDQVLDATHMPFRSSTLKCIFMNNVLHHIPRADLALKEVSRCLRPGGLFLIVDQYPGFPAKWIYKYLHHEDFDDQVKGWDFPAKGPLSSANGALPWIIFFRDRWRFEVEFPDLEVVNINIHTPLRYWLAGGLKKWTLLPMALYPLAAQLDQLLVKQWKGFGSFMDVTIRKRSIEG